MFSVVGAAEALLPGGRMTEWQRDWCTAEIVASYLRGRNGDVASAGEILAQALRWRLEHKDILSGARAPEWQSDLRIIARCDSGQPVLYMCCRHHLPVCNVQAVVEHVACVLEAAVRSMGRERQFDVVVDAHGFASGHDARALLPLLRMAPAYRERLRTALVVDAPPALRAVYGLAAPALAEATRRKVVWSSRGEALEHLRRLCGEETAEILRREMAGNRVGRGCVPGAVLGRRLPSELRTAGVLVQRERPGHRQRHPLGRSGWTPSGALCGAWAHLGRSCCRRRPLPLVASSKLPPPANCKYGEVLPSPATTWGWRRWPLFAASLSASVN